MINSKYWKYFPILNLISGEMLIFDGKIILGLAIHLINLLIIIIMIIFGEIIFGNLNLEMNKILQSLSLLTILRIINLSMPQFFTTTLLQYPLIYGLMFVPIYLTIKNQQISPKEIGINFNKLYLLPITILIGIIMAIIEYRIITPIALINKINYSNIILISIIMITFIGIIEEIIFRSILQTRLKKIFGIRYGILLSGILFGVMHSTYGLINEILFASIFGIILGYIFYKFKSIIFNISIHGTANIMLFGIYPFKMSIISNAVYSSNIINTGGKLMSISLIILLSISFLVADTKYWNEDVSKSIKLCFNSLTLAFAAIVLFKFILVI